MAERERPDCYRCRSFFVTYEPQRPYGCRVFGFEGRLLPSVTVERSSGEPCRAFEPRAQTPPRERR